MSENSRSQSSAAPSVDSFVPLVVEDDAMVRAIVVEYLHNFGFKTILEARNGREAQRFLRDYKIKIDIVISDWEMPKMDGHLLLKYIRNDPVRWPMKFIMVTSQNSRERVKISQARQLKVDAYIVKPFNGEIFRSKVFGLLGIYRGSGEAA